MKKHEGPSLPKMYLSEEKLNYYKYIGEQSASQIFVKNKNKPKVSSLSPMAAQNSLIHRKSRVEKIQFLPKNNLITSESNLLPVSKSKKASPLALSPPLSYSVRNRIIETSRDVSYIKDSIQSPSSRNVSIRSLPLDIKIVKELVNSAEQAIGRQGTEISSKNLNEGSSEAVDFEKMWRQHPSGRAESQNLKTWVAKMKEIYSGEDFFYIYSLAAIEITRQVTVHCNERGMILQEILDFFSSFSKNSQKNAELVQNHTKDLKNKVFADFKEKEKKLLDELQDLKHSKIYYQQILEEKSKKLKRLKEKLKDCDETIETLRTSLFSDNLLVLRPSKSQLSPENALRPKASVLTFSRHNTFLAIETADQSVQTSLFFANSLQFDNSTQTTNSLAITHQGLGIQIYTKISLPISRKPRPLIETTRVQSQKRIKSPSSIAYNNRQAKNSDSPLNELCRKINERDKMILMLKNLVSNNEGSDKITVNGKNFPKIVFSQEASVASTNIDAYQSGFEAGFESGFQLGMSQAEEQNSNLESSSQSSGENSKILEESLSFFSETSDEDNEEAVKSQKKSKIRIENLRKSVLKSILANPELASGHSPKISMISLSKIIEFKFSQRFYKDNKRSIPLNILENILEKKADWVKRKANISLKMLNKQISMFYQAYILKSDYSEPLLHFIYEDIQQKSGLKKLGNKKFVHFLCSLIARSTSLRTKNFLRFIGAGWITSQSNYSYFSLKFYLDCFNFVLTNKNGIAIIDDSADKSLIPTSRALDCIKEKTEIQKKTLSLISLVEKNTEPDPKKFNKCGMIELELFLSFMLEAFEETVLKIIENIEILIGSIKFAEDQSAISQLEAKMIIGKFCQDRPEEFPDNELLIEDFCMYCVRKMILVEDIKTIVPSPSVPSNEILLDVQKTVDQLFIHIKALKLVKVEDYKALKQKLKVLSTSLHKREAYDCFLASQIYQNQIN